ncbi:MAG: tripartite tricarboxylate transporter substrate binding protein [Burkholderiales bacterium]|nr:tripartite tricarboxylate transporter substrate binding protein [Burkholderiales bacterium]
MLLLLAALATAAAVPAHAQPYPAKPIRIVVTFPLGGAPDILARLIGAKLQESWGQPVVVDNKPGAGGNIGAEFVARSPADGYTLVMGTVGTHAINASLYAKMPYDPIRDFAPVILVASTPNLLVVNPNVPAKSVQELIALARAKPGELAYGSPGIGTSIHVSGELFNTLAGVRTVHVPYKGRQFAIPDLLAGQIQFMFDNMPSALPVAKEGKLRALAVTSARRHPAAPDIPTMAEAGLPGFEATSWFAVYAPAGTPPDVVAKLNAEIDRILALPDVKEKLGGIGLDVAGGPPEHLAAFTRAELAKWSRVVKESGAKAE